MNNRKWYAGIGSRETPPEILSRLEAISQELRLGDWWLRSGGAFGADSAFAKGALTNCAIYRPEHATDQAMAIASQYHPAWNRCSDAAKKLHGRNVFIILGPRLDSPVKFVCCWTKQGALVGGTGLGLRIALAHQIPIINLGQAGWEAKLERWMIYGKA